jgi:hypothetical protein
VSIVRLTDKLPICELPSAILLFLETLHHRQHLPGALFRRLFLGLFKILGERPKDFLPRHKLSLVGQGN